MDLSIPAPSSDLSSPEGGGGIEVRTHRPNPFCYNMQMDTIQLAMFGTLHAW